MTTMDVSRRRRQAAATDAAGFAVSFFTAVPVQPRKIERRSIGGGMLLAPGIGALLGLAAGLVVIASQAVGLGAPFAAVAVIALLALATRAQHLDGLCDLSNGLASRRPPTEALELMRHPGFSPIGIAAVQLILFLQIAAVYELITAGTALPALILAAAVARAAVPFACRTGIPAAKARGVGKFAAETVTTPAAVALGCMLLIGAVLLAYVSSLAMLQAAAAVLVGVASALALLQVARKRLGGITGDVFGALIETAFTAALIILALG